MVPIGHLKVVNGAHQMDDFDHQAISPCSCGSHYYWGSKTFAVQVVQLNRILPFVGIDTENGKGISTIERTGPKREVTLHHTTPFYE